MSGTGLAGLAIGVLVGLVNYLAIGRLAERVELAETRRVLRIVALADLVALPVAGFLIGAYVWG